MPPKGDPLTAEQVATLKAWIDRGRSTKNIGPTSSRCKSRCRTSRTRHGRVTALTIGSWPAWKKKV